MDVLLVSAASESICCDFERILRAFGRVGTAISEASELFLPEDLITLCKSLLPPAEGSEGSAVGEVRNDCRLSGLFLVSLEFILHVRLTTLFDFRWCRISYIRFQFDALLWDC
jgi:hypothetical protein